MIVLNVIGLSIYDYSDRDDLTLKNKVLWYLDITLTYIFVVESVIKILAMGFIIHHNAYMREGWNVIDFIIAFSR